MTAVSRTAQFAKVHKILKKHYKPVAPRADRSVLEHLMFACCLEDAGYEAAEEAFAALEHTFFDWNEVRVTSLSELSEVMARLPDPRVAGNRIKRILHGIFEATYSFDLEDKRKKNLGPTVKWLEKLDGATKFIVAYLVQSALGGHQIPIDSGTMAVLRILDLVTDKDAAAGVVPGLERAVAKSKGIEFGSLLHQLGAEYHGQSVFAGGPRHPAANRARPPRSGSPSAGWSGTRGKSRPPSRPRPRRRGSPRRESPPPRPRAQRPAAARRPAARARAASRPPAEAVAPRPSPPPGPARPRPGAGGPERPPRRRPPARNARRPKPPRKRPRRRDSPNANHDKVRCGKRSAVHIHALSLAAARNARPRSRRCGRPLAASGCCWMAAVLAGAWSAAPASAEPSPPVAPTVPARDCWRARPSPSCRSSRRPRPIATARRRWRWRPPAAHTKQRGEFRQALRMYQRALRLDPQLDELAQMVVLLAYALDQDDVAVRYLKMTDPADDDPGLLQDLGNATGGTRRSCRGCGAAGAGAGRAKRREGRRRDHPFAHASLAGFAASLEQYPKAADHFAHVMPRDRESPAVRPERGRPEETAGQGQRNVSI